MAEKILEKIAEVPAVVMGETVDTSIRVGNYLDRQTPVKKAKHYWRLLGPGLTTGAADDDPSGVATYSQTGARYGFQLLWLSLFTFPLMSVVQEMCARIGLVTGRGLAANIRIYFPRWVLYLCTLLLLIANSLNIGADLGAMAKASQLLLPQVGFAPIVIFFAVLSLILQIFTSYASYARILKLLALILFSYILTAFTFQMDWNSVAFGALVPAISFTREQIFIIVAVLGTTISPYLFFWQTSQEVEEQILEGKTTIESRREATDEEIKDMRIDVWSGMFISNLVMFFIIAVCAATLYHQGITNINTAADAALALKPLAGDYAFLLFAAGIIGTGLLAVPVLAGSAAYAISESFLWKSGLHRKLKDAYAFYGVIIISMVVGLLLNFIGLDPIKVLIYSAVLNGLIAPVIIILIVLLSQNEKVMGQRVNNRLTSVLGWFVTIIMVLAGSATIIAQFLPE